jgi:hypothetical protein
MDEIDQVYACRATGPSEREPDFLDRAWDALVRLTRRMFS